MLVMIELIYDVSMQSNYSIKRKGKKNWVHLLLFYLLLKIMKNWTLYFYLFKQIVPLYLPRGKTILSYEHNFTTGIVFPFSFHCIPYLRQSIPMKKVQQ
jgi:hypothetical protein